MISKTLLIKNKSGIHARPAALLVKTIKSFSSDVTLKHKDKEYNAKNLMRVMGACIKSGEEVEFICSGSDENEALSSITELIEGGLGE